MGTRATRTLPSIVFRCLRRQLHSPAGSEKQFPLSPGSSAVFSSCSASSFNVQGRIDGGQQEPELWHIKKILLDPEASSFDLAHKLSMKDPITKLWQSRAPSQDRSTDVWSSDVFSGRVSRGVQHWTGDKITEGHNKEAIFVRDLDFFSRYLQWRSDHRSVHCPESRNYQEAAAATVTAVDIDGIISPCRHNCGSGCVPCLLQTSSSLNFHQEPSMIIPLEADSVKRKRKKKMNKHKQRKLRRRDRHRN